MNDKIKFVSIDSSTNKTGMAFFENGELVDYKLLDWSKEKNTDLRIRRMCQNILDELNDFRPDIIQVERPQGNGRNIDMMFKLSKIIGVILSYAIQYNLVYNEYNPSEWRKLAGIQQGKKKREELKALSIEYVKDKYNIDVNDDVADAIVMGHAVLNFYNNLRKE